MIETLPWIDPDPRAPPTYALTEEEIRAEVLERLPEMVVKPREGYGAQGNLVGRRPTRKTWMPHPPEHK